MEKEQQQKERLLSDYLILIEIPVIGLGYDAVQIINAARYSQIRDVSDRLWIGVKGASCVLLSQG